MKLLPHLARSIFSLLLAFTASGCGLPKVSLPKLSMPSIDVPFVGNDRTAPSNDPQVPYTVQQALSTGHTLDLAVYAGQRSPDKVFVGAVMVDEVGEVDLAKFGKVRVAGMKAHDAVRALEAAFRRKTGQSLITVQLLKIESTPLLSVLGSVKQPGIIQYYDGATPASILTYVGGPDTRNNGRAVYVTRRGARAFHASYGSTSITLEPGDIVTYSDNL